MPVRRCCPILDIALCERQCRRAFGWNLCLAPQRFLQVWWFPGCRPINSTSGFLPSKQGQRTRLLESLRGEAATLIFYEAPHRILESLDDIAATLGDREIVVARELTKIHEEVLRGTAGEIRSILEARDAVRGEFVVLVAKASEPVHDETPPEEAVALLVSAGIDRMDAMKTVARERGLSKREVYKLVSGPKLK